MDNIAGSAEAEAARWIRYLSTNPLIPTLPSALSQPQNLYQSPSIFQNNVFQKGNFAINGSNFGLKMFRKINYSPRTRASQGLIVNVLGTSE